MSSRRPSSGLSFRERSRAAGLRVKKKPFTITKRWPLWERRERRRLEILAMIDEAEASLARGEGREITKESMKALAEELRNEFGVVSLPIVRGTFDVLIFRYGCQTATGRSS